MAIYGTGQISGLPITYFFQFNGVDTPWALERLDSVASFSNSAQPIDGSYEISDLQITFIDHDGAIWGTLGNGTSCLNLPVTFSAMVGGNVNVEGFGPNGDRPQLDNYGSGQPFNLHSGKITRVSRKDRCVTIESKSKMQQLGSMAWNFPVVNNSSAWVQTGTFFFYPDNVFGFDPASGTAALETCKFNRNDAGDEFEVYAYIAPNPITAVDALYPLPAGRGTTTCPPPWALRYVGPEFHWAFPQVKCQGTYLGTLFGAITTDDEAKQYGFANVQDATAASHGGTVYPMSKTRLNYQFGTLTGNNFIFRKAALDISGRPVDIYNELLTGAYVYPYFTGADVDSSSLTDFGVVTAYAEFTASTDPDEAFAIDSIKNFMESTFSLFSVTAENTFQISSYGPKNLNYSIPTIGSNDVVSSETSNDIDKLFNRVALSYGYNNGTFQKAYGTTLPGWTADIDRPYIVESKWINGENEAFTFVSRSLTRHKNSISEFTLTLPLTWLGINIGSLYTLSDIDVLPNNSGSKTIQVVGYDKDISDSRNVQVTAWDADSLYQKRGYMFFDAGATIPRTGGHNDTAVWGHAIGGNWYDPGAVGTAEGLNANVYGTVGYWW